jgi:transcriptional antiterminator NusG
MSEENKEDIMENSTPEPEEFNPKDIDVSKEGEDISKDKLDDVDNEIAEEEKKVKKIDSKLGETNKKIKKNSEELSDVDETQALIDELKVEKNAPIKEEVKPEVKEAPRELSTHIYALRTTANREDQVMDFLTSHAEKKNFNVYAVIRAHGMRGYIFIEADTKGDAEQAAFNVPYARGILPKEIDYHEIEHMLEQVKREVNIQQNDIVEIISGPFKRENAKIIRLDKGKEEVVVELLEAAVPIPITLKLDAVKVIRREAGEKEVDNSQDY